MADKVIITVGDVTADVTAQGFALTRKGGTLVLTGMSHDGQAPTVTLPGTILECLGEDDRRLPLRAVQPAPRHPVLADLMRRGQLNLADSITNRYPLAQVSQGYRDLEDGKNIRGIIEHGDA